jgi:hypothetical protein
MGPEDFTNVRAVDCDDAEYFGMKRWSNSALKLMPDRPEEFHGLYVADPPLWTFKVTDDMTLGTNVHGSLLEQKDLLVIPPDVLTSNGQRRGGKWEDWKAEHEHNPGLLPQQVKKAKAMRESALADPVIRKLLEADGEVEKAYLWEDSPTGLPFKMKLDKRAVFPNGWSLVDLKCTGLDATDERIIGNHIATMRYHRQMAMYADALTVLYGPPLLVAMVFIQNKPPYAATAWDTLGSDGPVLEIGRFQNRKATDALSDRLKSGLWHGDRFARLSMVKFPKWAMDEDDAGPIPPASLFDEFAEYAT